MRGHETITLARGEYDALLERTRDLEDRLAAVDAGGDVRVPHEVALAVIAGASPVRAFRDHQGLSLREYVPPVGRHRQLPLRDRAGPQARFRRGHDPDRRERSASPSTAS